MTQRRTRYLGQVHLKDEMPFQAELFCPEGENLACKFVLKKGDKQFVLLFENEIFQAEIMSNIYI